VAQDQDLDVLRGGAPGEQHQPAEYLDCDQVQQSNNTAAIMP
jgi:hypothetical protein